MVLAAGAEVPVATTTQTTILTHTAAAGEFLRGWHVYGDAEAKVEIQIDATLKSIGTVPRGPFVVDDWTESGHIITPIPLSAGEDVTIKVERKESASSADFRGELF